MMPVIRVSEATWKRLKGYAIPLEDSAEDVVRIALDALDKAGGRPTPPAPLTEQAATSTRRARKTAQGVLPQKDFRTPLLEVLQELGGRASVKDIRRSLEPKLAPRLGEADYRIVSSDQPRWWNAACWERDAMVKEGLLRSDSERGVWELAGAEKRP